MTITLLGITVTIGRRRASACEQAACKIDAMLREHRAAERRRLSGAPFAIVGGVDSPDLPALTRATYARCVTLLDCATPKAERSRLYGTLIRRGLKVHLN